MKSKILVFPLHAKMMVNVFNTAKNIHVYARENIAVKIAAKV